MPASTLGPHDAARARNDHVALEHRADAVGDVRKRRAFAGPMSRGSTPGVREHFFAFLAREYPDLVEGYGRLYPVNASAVPAEER